MKDGSRKRVATEVRLLEAVDIPSAARLHERAMPDDLLSAAGPRLLSALYKTATRDDRTRVFTASDRGRLSGILIASLSGDSLLRRTALASPAACLLGGLRIIHNRGWTWLWDVLKQLVGGRTDLPKAEIVYFFVADDARGRGIGSALLDAANAYFLYQDQSEWHAKVAEDNDVGIAAYASRGGRRHGRFRHAGRYFVAMRFP